MTKLVDLPIELIRFHRTQVRAHYDETVIEDYAERMAAGDKFPPIIVFFDGNEHWLADGAYRCRAFQKLKWTEIPCDLRKGLLRDAILFAAGSNSSHGCRRTNADKVRAVTLILSDPEWSQRSTNWIAEQCHVGNKLVDRIREKDFGGTPLFVERKNGRRRQQRRSPWDKAHPDYERRDKLRAKQSAAKAVARDARESAAAGSGSVDIVGTTAADVLMHLTRAALAADRANMGEEVMEAIRSAQFLVREHREMAGTK